MKLRKIINPYLGKNGYNCFGCCPTNPVGLHLQFWEEGDDIVSEWSPNENYQGWVDTLHGGIIATLMDEVAGWVIPTNLHTSAVTSRLNIQYKKPVMTTEKKLTIRAHIVSNVRSFYTIKVTLTDSAGEICNEAEAVYYAMSKEKATEMGFEECQYGEIEDATNLEKQ